MRPTAAPTAPPAADLSARPRNDGARLRGPVSMPFSARPARHALADPSDEHDACGLAFIARYRGPADHLVVQQALTALRNMEHRGGVGGDEGTGDGAGITVQVP